MSIFEYDEQEVRDYIREEARIEEAQRYSQLILQLTEEGKSDLIVKAASDDVFRKRLYREYQL